MRKIKIIKKISLFFFLGSVFLAIPSLLLADFTNPTQSPPNGNVSKPIYSQGSMQVLFGGLNVGTGGLSGGNETGPGVIGISNTSGTVGSLFTNPGVVGSALYGNAFSADADDYSGRFYGGLGVLMSSGDIHFFSRYSGISWPRVSDEIDLYGVMMSAEGALRLIGHGNGIEFLNQTGTTTLATISETGNMNLLTGSLCFGSGSGDCKSSWADVGSSSGWTDDGTIVRLTTLSDRVGIGTNIPEGAKLDIRPTSDEEGIRIISSNYSPLVIRNSLNNADLFRVRESGNLEISGTINSRLIGTGLGNIPVSSGSGILNIGLNANYLEGHSWNDVVNLLADSSPQSPERHYFISASTTNGNANGYSGLDLKCNSDVNALPGRSYHVWAEGTTNRGFNNGVLYANKRFGTFSLSREQDPDLCVVLGVNCESNTSPGKVGNWKTNSSPVWNTGAPSTCSSWSSNSGSAGSRLISALHDTYDIGIVDTTNVDTYGCGNSLNLLCIENSGPIFNPGTSCGNGIIDPGEYCDDGDNDDDATCPANCQDTGGYCGDGFWSSNEQCEYNKRFSSAETATYGDRNMCTTSCTWTTTDPDGDGRTGQNDCWNRSGVPDDANAYSSSTYKSSTTQKDYNCDAVITSEPSSECQTWGEGRACAGSPNCSDPSPLVWSDPSLVNDTGVNVCPSPNTHDQATAFCKAQWNWTAYSQSPYCDPWGSVWCAWCGVFKTYYY